MPARQIPAHGRQTAPGIFDEGPHNQISSHLGRLQLFHKFSVTVIHQNGNIISNLMNRVTDRPNLHYGKGITCSVSPGALNDCRFDLLFLNSGLDSGKVRLAVMIQFHLPIFYTVRAKSTWGISRDPDHTLDRIIGRASHIQELVSRLQGAKKGTGNGVGPVDKLEAHQGILRMENVRVDLFQFIPPHVVISIPRRAGKVTFRHPEGLKGIQNLLRIALRDSVYDCKLLCQIRFRLLRQRSGFIAYL